MKLQKLTGCLLLLLSLAALPAFAAEEALPNPEVQRITPQELKGLIDAGTPPVIVDTRDSLSYNTGHIPGAINIYYDPAGDPMNREMMLIALPMDKLVVLYCP
ncbi:MAG TPA: rhodanese-like domain-containing protein [Gammaproteobacteria bacterium]|nr:rhodanese-like domain-containing protein [Gammaproteobacteria bacterium]